VAGRNRTCCAPRFRRALYRLSYGHMSRRGWPRTSDLLFVRQALVPTELLALVRIRDKGSNLDLQVQGLASCRLDDPGRLRAGATAPGTRRRLETTTLRPLHLREVDAKSCQLCHVPLVPNDVFQATRPTLRPWIVQPALLEREMAVFVEELWSPVRARQSKKALVNQGSK
jgi:hypothetical protein